MGISFLGHSAEYGGLIDVRHSIQHTNAKTLGLENVDHLIIDPHGSLAIPPVQGLQEFLDRYDAERLRQYLAVRRDLGIPEFRDALLREIPNTLAVSIDFSRGLADPNRTKDHALQNIVRHAPDSVRAGLSNLHSQALTAVDEILTQLKPGVKITLAHSTEPFNDAEPGLEDLDLLEPESFDRFLRVRTNVGKGRGPVIPVCFITGRGDEPTRDDSLFRSILQARLMALGIPFDEDDIYSTRFGEHMTSSYMRARPGDVNAVDWPRDMLATGEVRDGSFSLTDSEADSVKVEVIANLHADALRESMARARRLS